MNTQNSTEKTEKGKRPVGLRFDRSTGSLTGKLRYPSGHAYFDVDKPVDELQGHATPERIQALRVFIFTLCGGGMIGDMFIEQPGDAYIDARVPGLPVKRIYNARAIYLALLNASGTTPDDYPPVKIPFGGWLDL